MHARDEHRERGRAFVVAALASLGDEGQVAEDRVRYLVCARVPVTQLASDEREDSEPVSRGGAGERVRQRQLTPSRGSNHQNSFVSLSTDT